MYPDPASHQPPSEPIPWTDSRQFLKRYRLIIRPLLIVVGLLFVAWLAGAFEPAVATNRQDHRAKESVMQGE